MPGSKERKGKDGTRNNTQRQNASKDVAARKEGMPEARPKAKSGAPKAMKSGRQGSR